MSDALTFWTGNLNPSITQQITSGGTAVDLTGMTVDFKYRSVGGTAIGGGTATVESPATAGLVRYDWQSADVVDPGWRLVWWQVTSGSDTQDENEALIEFREHAPNSQPGYVELEQLKSSTEMTGYTYADADLQRAILAATRGIESACGRRFWLDPDATSVRLYTPTSRNRLMVDDFVTLTSVSVDRAGDGTFEETWTRGTHFVVEPANAVADYRPFESLKRRSISGYTFPCGIEDSVKVTAQFGWPSVPAPIEQATIIIASKLVKRTREAPFGIVAVGSSIDGKAAVRIAHSDPDVVPLLANYIRPVPFIVG